MIRAEDNDDEYEIIEVDSIVAGASMTVVDNLVYSYSANDIVRQWRFWPYLVSLNKEFNPVLIPGSDYYEYTFQFAEKL